MDLRLLCSNYSQSYNHTTQVFVDVNISPSTLKNFGIRLKRKQCEKAALGGKCEVVGVVTIAVIVTLPITVTKIRDIYCE